jgi:hypothetical protein
VTGALGGEAAAADEIAGRVLDLPGVAALHGGGLVQVATVLPGRRVDGVRLDDDRVLVSVVAAFGQPLPAVADSVRRVAGPLAGGRRVDVHIADVQLPGEEQLALPPGPSGPATG